MANTKIKQKLLAVVLTVCLLASAFTALSLTSSADEVENILYAYIGTLTVDGKAEPHAVVTTPIDDTARIGASWDYENIYVTVAALENNAITKLELSVGGAKADVEISDAGVTVTGAEGADAKAESGYIEVAIPLSQITLDIADSTASADLTAKVTADTKTAEYAADLFITGRSPFAAFGEYANSSLNGYGIYKSALAVGDATGLAWNSDTEDIKAVVKDGKLHLRDFSSNNTIRADALCTNLYELIDVSEDGSYSLSFDLLVNDLPIAALPTALAQTAVPGSATSPMFTITVACRAVPTKGTGPIFMITNDADKGLMATVNLSGGFIKSLDSFPLGVKEGEAFNLVLEQRPDASFAVIVNGKTVKEYTQSISVDTSFSGFPAYVVLSLLRGAKLDVGEGFDIVCSGATYSTLEDVDTARLASLAKNGNDAPDNKLSVTKTTVTLDGKNNTEYTNSVNVGLTKVYAAIDEAADTLNFYLKTANLEKVSFEIGDKKLDLTLTEALLPPENNSRCTVTPELSGIDGATAEVNTSSYGSVEIAVPLSAIAFTDDAVSFKVTAERSYNESVTALTTTGTLVIANEPEVTTPAETTPEETTTAETTPAATTPADTTAAGTGDDTTAADDTSADETPADSAADTTEAEKSGCGSSLAGYGLALVLGSAVVATVASKKKED